MKTAGVVLCGGASRRMGRDKAMLPVDGVPLLLRAIRVLRASLDRVIVAAGPAQELPAIEPTVTVVRDSVTHFGPLAGIAASLTECDGYSHLLVMPCDCPALTPDTVVWMLERLTPNRSLFVSTQGIVHPLPAVYCTDGLLEKVRRLMDDGRRSLKGLMDVLDYDVATDPPDEAVFQPCNTPEEFDRMIRRPGSVRE